MHLSSFGSGDQKSEMCLMGQNWGVCRFLLKSLRDYSVCLSAGSSQLSITPASFLAPPSCIKPCSDLRPTLISRSLVPSAESTLPCEPVLQALGNCMWTSGGHSIWHSCHVGSWEQCHHCMTGPALCLASLPTHTHFFPPNTEGKTWDLRLARQALHH